MEILKAQLHFMTSIDEDNRDKAFEQLKKRTDFLKKEKYVSNYTLELESFDYDEDLSEKSKEDIYTLHAISYLQITSFEDYVNLITKYTPNYAEIIEPIGYKVDIRDFENLIMSILGTNSQLYKENSILRKYYEMYNDLVKKKVSRSKGIKKKKVSRSKGIKKKKVSRSKGIKK